MKSFIAFWALLCKFLVTLPVIALLVYVTIANREGKIEFSWSPFHSPEILSLPLIIFAAVILGFLWGSLILWSNTLQMKEEARANKKRIANLEAQLDLQRVEYEKLKGKIASADTGNAPRIAGPEILP